MSSFGGPCNSFCRGLATQSASGRQDFFFKSLVKLQQCLLRWTPIDIPLSQRVILPLSHRSKSASYTKDAC